MSTRTYTTKINGREIHLTMKKDLARAVAGAIEKAFKVNGHWMEITGVIGGEEHRAQLWTPFGGAPVSVSDPETYAADCAALLESLPETLTVANCQEYVQKSREIFEKHLPVLDQRTTPEEHAAEIAERAAKVEKWETERAETLAAQVSEYGDSPDPVKVPEGMTAVVIQLNYNNSDSMTDYFDSNHGHGPEYLLGFVSGRPARTEKLHRDMVAKFPELQGLKWNWHKQEYSMGHGTWLESEVVTYLDGVTTSSGHTSPAAWWEVSFGYDRGAGFVPFRGYAAAQSPRPTTTPSTPETSTAPVVRGEGYTLETEREWTWISFPSKPTPEVLDTLRSNGGRWGKRRHAWYFTRHISNDEVRQWLGMAAPVAVDPDPEPEPAPVVVNDVIIPALEDITMADEVPSTPEPAPVAVDPEPEPAPVVTQVPTPAPAPVVVPVAEEIIRPSRYALFE